MKWLRQGTAATVKFGPFVDSTDGITPETGLTIQKANVRVSKNGGNMAAASSDQGASDAGAPHDEIGVYDGAFNTTDTNTLGRLRIDIQMSGAVPWWDEWLVVPALVYDSMVTGGPAFPLFGVIDSGTAQSASGTGLVIAAASAFDDDVLIGGTAFVYGSTQAYWQERQITDNALSGDALTVDTWTVTPSGTLSYILFGGGPGSATLPPPVDVTKWKGSTAPAMTGDAYAVVNSGSFGNSAIKTVADAISAKTTNLPSDPADASDIAAAFSTVNSTLATIATYIDTEVAAIKAKTDLLTFSTGNALQADLQRIENATTIDGVTITKVFRAILAILFSKTSGLTAGVGTATFRDADDNSNFASVTVDEHGNRTAATIN